MVEKANPIDLIPKKLVKSSSDEVKKNKLIGFYFSAHWCPPCRGFTPVLAETYNIWKKNGKSIEIIFVSSDKDPDSFGNYFKEMPWDAVPFDDKDGANNLKKKFNVTGIPKFVVCDASGNVLDDNARGTVQSKKEAAIDVWK